jgi:hypothetical protein
MSMPVFDGNWDDLAALARQAPRQVPPGMPEAFAQRVLAGLDQRQRRDRERLVWVGALAASLLAVVIGAWGWAGVAAGSPPAVEEVVSLEPVP